MNDDLFNGVVNDMYLTKQAMTYLLNLRLDLTLAAPPAGLTSS
jgi:hypothetical protein